MQTAQNTQKQRILKAFRVHTRLPVYLLIAPQPEGLGIAQYNARIFELRAEGYDIVNKTDDNGHTYFELLNWFPHNSSHKSQVDDVKDIFGIKDEPKQERLFI